ncbi:CP6K1 protein, partial [Pseudoatta argentina]
MLIGIYRKMVYDEDRESWKTKEMSIDIFNGFEGDALLAQAAIFFVAGRETSIATMTCALFELAKQPEMQKRVREETHKTIQDANDVTYEAVHNMKYLHQVINETLLYPPVPIIDRFPLSDDIFPGTKITDKKDIPVYVVLFGIQTDLRYYLDPMHFDPERFSDERKNHIVPCTFLPFGEGPYKLVNWTRSHKRILTMILRDYEVALHPSWKNPIDPRNVFISPPAGFLLNFKKI